MAGNRTLKLSILADVDDLRKKLNQSEDEVQGFGGKLDNWSKMAGAAFLAAGAAAAAYAGKLAIDGVKAAIEDEAAQLKLATTLKNVTGATNNQTKAVEDYILQTELAYGITDEQLRPSLDRLVRSTKNVEEAQKLQTLALNIAAGTGKDLESVTNALAKAHDGNLGALKKVGVSLDENIIKSKDFDAATAELAKTFKDQATIQADTFQGKLNRLKIAFDEGKETLGGFILDAIKPMVDLIVKNVIPALTNFSGGIKENLQPAINVFKPILEGLTSAFGDIRDAFVDNYDKLKPFYDLLKALGKFLAETLAPIIGETLGLAFKAFGKVLAGLVDTFAGIVDFFSKAYDKIKGIIDFLKNNPVSKLFSGASYDTSSNSSSAALYSTVPVMSSDSFMSNQGNTFINVTGALDPESVARQINDILTQSAARGGGAVTLGGLV